MKRYFYLLFLPILMTLTCCHHEEEGPTPPQPGQETGDTPPHYGRTVLVYMAMQNSLGVNNYHYNDSIEIAQAMRYIPKNDRLLLYIDDTKLPRIYELSSALREPKLIKRWPEEISSADAHTLTEVLNLAGKSYPSDSYGLVMGSHADGWLPKEESPAGKSRPRKSFGIDVGPDGNARGDLGVAGSIPDKINIDELASAIIKSNIDIDYLLFDACLMQSIEAAYALRHACHYICASPIAIAADGAYYTDLVHYGLFSSDATDVARTYVDYYKGEGTVACPDDYGTVMSCVRTEELETLATTIGQCLSRLTPAAKTPEERIAILKRSNLSAALNYHAYAKGNFYRPHYYDLVSAFKALGADDTMMESLHKALDEVVVFKDATDAFWIGPSYFTFKTMPSQPSDWCGVSMFVPQQIYTDYASMCVFGDLNEAIRQTEWWQHIERQF